MSGQTDGEASERMWSKFGRFHNILLEMSPVKRTEMLEDLCREIRQSKRFINSESLKKKYNAAVSDIEKLQLAFDAFNIGAGRARQYWNDERHVMNQSNIRTPTTCEETLKHHIQMLILECSFQQRDLYSRSTPGMV